MCHAGLWEGLGPLLSALTGRVGDCDKDDLVRPGRWVSLSSAKGSAAASECGELCVALARGGKVLHREGSSIATEVAASNEEGEEGGPGAQRVVWYERRAWEGEEAEMDLAVRADCVARAERDRIPPLPAAYPSMARH